ncbi:MAG TPA: shikimate dehydrogenase [Ilumatobacteraceae bacterium]|nr:shikimate dehydrogenase [Ilumatobacteraceae bacterium]HRB03971.1 shikimate dehydrogenase [Ilumatobacteraceae bacterium]
MITGATRVAAVIGSPVRHSLSPALHNAAFAQLGVDWVYTAFDVFQGEAQSALDAMRTLHLGGLSVTMPHKEAVASAVDLLDPAAAALRSVNTVVPQIDGSLMGYSTDGAGFVASLAAAGVSVVDRSICVLGAGAAARSIIDALGRSGAARVAVVNRTAAAAEEAALLAGAAGVVGSMVDVSDAHLVINATSVGMGGNEMPIDSSLLHAGQVVADIVYHPRETALLRAARSAGAATVEGLGMLVHQAALQQQLWHGLQPDIAVMAAAAEQELAARR